MNILGIETSCDETACAIVQDGRYILSNVVASSLKDHQAYGGIIPEIASRRQMELIQLVVAEALAKAELTFNDIDAIAVTHSPGLIGSLLVGISFARSLAYSLKKPLVEINHIEGHLYANFVHAKGTEKELPKLPAAGLVVSGGHSSLFYIKDFTHYKVLGQTRDDAAGEAFDKVARIMNLGYPGGPVIDRLAKTVTNTKIRFPHAPLPGSYDFSFSGVKTSVLYHVLKHQKDPNFSAAEVAYAFQDSVVKILVDKCMDLCLAKNLTTLLVGGGVAANSALRTRLDAEAAENNVDVFYPPLVLCLDNAAMIAGLGFHYLRKRK